MIELNSWTQGSKECPEATSDEQSRVIIDVGYEPLPLPSDQSQD